jgi:CheY-like chemotaxis protein
VNVYGEMHRMIPSLASIHGYRATEIEVEHHARKFGRSKYGLKRFFRGFMDMQTVYFLKNYRERPLHFFGGQAAFSLVGGGALFALALLPWWGAAAAGVLSTIATVLLVAAAPLLAIGFLSEMILRGQVETERRPPIAEVIPARGFLAEPAESPVPITRLPSRPVLLSQGDVDEDRKDHILVVDDDPVTRRMLRHYLEEAGFAVSEAADGTEALARVDDSTAVVLLDLNMTGHNDGVDCLRQLRKSHAHVDIIVVSGGEEIDTAVRTMKLGAFDYILKPADPQQIIKTVRKAINFREIAAA